MSLDLSNAHWVMEPVGGNEGWILRTPDRAVCSVSKSPLNARHYHAVIWKQGIRVVEADNFEEAKAIAVALIKFE